MNKPSHLMQNERSPQGRGKVPPSALKLLNQLAWEELKRKNPEIRDRQSEHQMAYQKSVEAAGGLYFIATSFQQFYDWYLKTFE